MTKKYLDYDGMLYFWQKIRNTFVSDITWDSTNKKLVRTKKTGTNGAAETTDLVTFATVATSGSYNDLSNKPTIVSDVSYNSTSKKIQQTKGSSTTDVVTLSTVATSGSYNDLSNKPSIPGATSTSPKMDGTATVGSETTWAKGDHIHPTDTTRMPWLYITDTSGDHKIYETMVVDDDGYNLIFKQINDNSTVSNYLSIPTNAGANAAIANYVPLTQKGAANGVAPLNSSGKIDTSYYTDNDTKNTAGSTDSSSKLFIIGATGQTGSSQTYSQDTAYVGTDGHLYSNSVQVVNLSGSQALTNKTYNGYTLGAACAKGVVTSISSDSTDVPTVTAVKGYVQSAITGSASFQGTAPTTFAPTNYSKGMYWVVGTAGTYAGQVCEAGDMIFAIDDYDSAYSASDFDVIQTNLDITSITNAEIDTIVAA